MMQDFKKINKRYDSLFKEGLKKGRLPMRSTDYGFWGTASCFNIFEFFQKVNLEKYDNFLDLGSGDGRVVLLASLFTNAVGIEGDEKLVKESIKIRDELGLNADFICDDFNKHDFSRYDFLFMYPDKGFTDEFEQKLNDEFEGDLYVYNHIYLPNTLEKGKTVWVEQMPIIHYPL